MALADGCSAAACADARGRSTRALRPRRSTSGCSSGPMRAQDGRHELVSVMQSISLADELTLESGARGGAAQDEVVCPGVPGAPGENLAAVALRLFREAPAGMHRRCA